MYLNEVKDVHGFIFLLVTCSTYFAFIFLETIGLLVRVYDP